MLAPDFRITENLKFLGPMKAFIGYNYGDNMYKGMELDLQNVESCHNNLTQVVAHKTDASQMAKFRQAFLDDYKNFSVIYKYVTFGKLKTNVNLEFVWYDGFTKEKKKSPLPQLEMYSALYNFAVASMRQACYMDLAGDGTKEASALFQQSAWVFEHLQSCVVQLPPGEATVDFSKESLSMCSNLCLAQAQYLFFRKARDNKMKKGVLAKICAQIAIYFQRAFEDNQINPKLRAFENGHFANVLGYHAKYYNAMAWNNLGEAQCELTDKESKGCGKAVGMMMLAKVKFEEALPFANTLGGQYATNFGKVYQECADLMKRMMSENKTVYYDTVMDADDCPKPDPNNFVKTIDISAEINAKANLDNQFRHLVPPAVRQMQDDLKNILQGIVSEHFGKVQKCNDQLNNFLKQMNLPMAIQSLSSSAEIPNELWAKIEEFQKKGSAQNFAASSQTNKSFVQINAEVLQAIEQAINEEEAQDTQMRASQNLGQIVPSGRVNGPYRQQIENYKTKMSQAANVDVQISGTYEANKANFDLLNKSRGDLSGMIPASAAGVDLSKNPVVMTTQNALDQLNEISIKKDEIMNEGVQMHEKFNGVEELMKVIQNHATKDEVFTTYRKQYSDHFAQNDELEQQRQNISQIIAQNGAALSQLIQSNKSDPAKQQFFAQINDAINSQVQLSNMFVQANQFYTQLNDQLIKLQQQVGDYKMSRDMQRNDAIKAGGGQPPQQPPPAGGMPGYGMPPMQPMQPGMPQMQPGMQPQQPYGQVPLGQSFNYGAPQGGAYMPPPAGFQNPYQK